MVKTLEPCSVQARCITEFVSHLKEGGASGDFDFSKYKVKPEYHLMISELKKQGAFNYRFAKVVGELYASGNSIKVVDLSPFHKDVNSYSDEVKIGIKIDIVASWKDVTHLNLSSYGSCNDSVKIKSSTLISVLEQIKNVQVLKLNGLFDVVDDNALLTVGKCCHFLEELQINRGGFSCRGLQSFCAGKREADKTSPGILLKLKVIIYEMCLDYANDNDTCDSDFDPSDDDGEDHSLHSPSDKHFETREQNSKATLEILHTFPNLSILASEYTLLCLTQLAGKEKKKTNLPVFPILKETCTITRKYPDKISYNKSSVASLIRMVPNLSMLCGSEFALKYLEMLQCVTAFHFQSFAAYYTYGDSDLDRSDAPQYASQYMKFLCQFGANQKYICWDFDCVFSGSIHDTIRTRMPVLKSAEIVYLSNKEYEEDEHLPMVKEFLNKCVAVRVLRLELSYCCEGILTELLSLENKFANLETLVIHDCQSGIMELLQSSKMPKLSTLFYKFPKEGGEKEKYLQIVKSRKLDLKIVSKDEKGVFLKHCFDLC